MHSYVKSEKFTNLRGAVVDKSSTSEVDSSISKNFFIQFVTNEAFATCFQL